MCAPLNLRINISENKVSASLLCIPTECGFGRGILSRCTLQLFSLAPGDRLMHPIVPSDWAVF
jgi:hypothetical protein